MLLPTYYYYFFCLSWLFVATLSDACPYNIVYLTLSLFSWCIDITSRMPMMDKKHLRQWQFMFIWSNTSLSSGNYYIYVHIVYMLNSAPRRWIISFALYYMALLRSCLPHSIIRDTVSRIQISLLQRSNVCREYVLSFNTEHGASLYT